MKTTPITLTVFAICFALFTSCNKDEEGGGEPFSQNSIEGNKQIVENSAIEMAQTLDDMKDLETVDAVVSLGNILDISDPLDSKTNKKSKVTATLGVIAGIGNGENSLHDLFRVIKSAGDLNEDPETLTEIWEEIVGTYTWNSAMEKWDYEPNSSMAVFNFPSTDGGITNDAVLTISNYTGVVTTNPFDEEYDGDLPASLNADLKVGSTELITYVYSAEYNADGIPTKVASDLTIETYKFSVDITNTDTEISASSKLTSGSDIVFEISGIVKGDFTEENIDANTETKTDVWYRTDYVWNPTTEQYEPVQVQETDEWTEVRFEEIARSASAKFQVFNTALKGDVNIKALVDELDKLYPEGYRDDPNFNEKAETQKEANITNQYVNLRAINVSAGEKIAEVEAYVVEDNSGGEYDYWMDFRLKFGDGSLVDLETYFEEGFEDFIAEINSMIRELNGEYDWGIEEIDY